LSGADWQPGTTESGADSKAFPKLPDSFGDGAAQTILIGERYSWCGGNPVNNSAFASLWAYPYNGWDYCPYFAARVGYVFNGATIPNTVRFQVQPAPFLTTSCNPHQASTGHSTGMNVCLGDASTRPLTKVLTASTFWAACTPNAKDLLGDDW
jgi:hypothetical protein